MKNRILFYLFIGITLFQNSSCVGDQKFVGSGNIIAEERAVSEFTKIEVEDVIHVEIVKGSEQTLSVEADDNLIDRLLTQVSGNTLIIKLKDGSYRNNVVFDVKISMPHLERLEMDDATEGKLEFNLEELEINLNDAADLVLIGESEKLNIEINDSGTINGFDFNAGTLMVNAEDASTLNITCTQKIEGTVKDASTIRYKGNPDIDVKVSDAGEVIDAN